MSALSKAGVGKGRNYGPPAAPCPQLLGACQASMHSSWAQNFPCCPQTSAATAPRNIIIVGTVVIIINNNNKYVRRLRGSRVVAGVWGLSYWVAK